jgi:hypothetical protein
MKPGEKSYAPDVRRRTGDGGVWLDREYRPRVVTQRRPEAAPRGVGPSFVHPPSRRRREDTVNGHPVLDDRDRPSGVEIAWEKRPNHPIRDRFHCSIPMGMPRGCLRGPPRKPSRGRRLPLVRIGRGLDIQCAIMTVVAAPDRSVGWLVFASCSTQRDSRQRLRPDGVSCPIAIPGSPRGRPRTPPLT